MGYIDSHAHIFSEGMNDLASVLKNIEELKMSKVMIICCTLEEAKKAIELAKTNDIFDVAVGIHPSDIKDVDIKILEELEQIAKAPEVKAIGEIGLDYHWDKDNHDQQKIWFIKQIEIANRLSKPIIIHSRDAIQETYDMLKENDIAHKGVMHCFSASKEMALQFVELGYYISLGGPITFKNGRVSKEVAGVVPLEFLLSETDSPYLTPEPFRGHKNEPSNVQYNYQEIAKVRKEPLEKVIEQFEENYHKLFDLEVIEIIADEIETKAKEDEIETKAKEDEVETDSKEEDNETRTKTKPVKIAGAILLCLVALFLCFSLTQSGEIYYQTYQATKDFPSFPYLFDIEVEAKEISDPEAQFVEATDFDEDGYEWMISVVEDGVHLQELTHKRTISNLSGDIISQMDRPGIAEEIDSKPTVYSNGGTVSVGSGFVSEHVTTYGVNCAGCYMSEEGKGGTSAGIAVGLTSVRQSNGEWKDGITYEGYYIIAADQAIPHCTIVEISEHGFEGSGLTSDVPFKAIVLDRGGAINNNDFDFYVGDQVNPPLRSTKKTDVKVEILSFGKRTVNSLGERTCTLP